MRKMMVMAAFAVALVAVSSAFAGNNTVVVADEPVTPDTVVTACPAECPAAAAADSAQTVQQDSVR